MFESAYSPCLAYELHLRGLRFATKVPVPLFYKGLEIPRAYEADVHPCTQANSRLLS